MFKNSISNSGSKGYRYKGCSQSPKLIGQSQESILVFCGPCEGMLSLALILLLLYSISFNTVYTHVFARSTHYPSPCPNNQNTPWIWDAFYEKAQRKVEVIVLFKRACYFNQTRWLQVVDQFPSYANKLSFGDKGKLLVDTSTYNVHIERLLKRQMKCLFYSENKLVMETWSEPIFSSKNHVSSAVMLVHCPLPQKLNDSEWDSISLRNDIDLGAPNNYSRFSVPFLVCKASNPRHCSGVHYPSSTKASKLAPKWDLAICTATMRVNRLNFVEWVEFHKLQGTLQIILLKNFNRLLIFVFKYVSGRCRPFLHL
jgi:hypothetical protein